MSARGAPLRFLGVVAICWVGARIALLWPQTGSLPEAIKAVVPLAPVMAAAAPLMAEAPTDLAVSATAAAPRPVSPPLRMAAPAPDPFRVQMALMALIQYGAPEAVAGSAPMPIDLPRAAAPDRLDPLPDRWSASGWFALRPGRGIGAAPGGSQLGGSQAGLRIAYRLVPRERIAAFARLTSPLAGKGREAAIGLEWQPTKANVRLVAERRFGLDGTPGGTGLGLIGGIDADAAGFRIEAYGQAGAIARRRLEPYADGAARFTRRVGGGDVRLSLGAGAWGAAQRDADRLDIGPSAVVAVDAMRVSLDWRQRIVGNARPGSGLALTLGGYF